MLDIKYSKISLKKNLLKTAGSFGIQVAQPFIVFDHKLPGWKLFFAQNIVEKWYAFS